MMLVAGDGPPDPVLTFDWTDAESASAAVVDAVAAATGDDPTSIEPLYAAVDPDALDAIVGSAAGSTRHHLMVGFEFNGVGVQLMGTGDGCVVPLP